MGNHDVEAAGSEVYDDLPGRCAKIDRRSTRYRFELEEAVPWNALAQPGQYFGLELLATLGVDTAPLRRDRDAFAAFEWSFAAATCAEFIELEEVVIAYLAEQRAHHRGIRSITLLEEEEAKHVALFRRYLDGLLAQRPAWAPALEQAVAIAPRSARRIVFGENYPDGRIRAYLFWLFTVLFEEYTVYLHDRLQTVADIQPAWLRAHAAHRQEEEQHVVTDREHLRAVRMTAAERQTWSNRFILWISPSIHEFTGLATAHRCFAALRPDVPIALAPFQRTGFRRDIARERSFKWTREGAPALADIVDADAPPSPIPTARHQPTPGEHAQQPRATAPPATTTPPLPEPAPRLRGAWSAAKQWARSFAQAGAPAIPSNTNRYRLSDLSAANESRSEAPRPAPPTAAPPSHPAETSPSPAVVALVRTIWADALERAPGSIDLDADFTSLGGDSLQAVQIHSALERHYKAAIPVEILLDCRTVRELAVYLARRYGAQPPPPAAAQPPSTSTGDPHPPSTDPGAARSVLPPMPPAGAAPSASSPAPHAGAAPPVTPASDATSPERPPPGIGSSLTPGSAPPPAAMLRASSPTADDRAVAIIAATCRFPGAANLDELWAMIAAGRTAFGPIPTNRWDPATLPNVRCRTGAFLDQPGAIDPDAFGLSETDVLEMDPQQRLFLELAAELVERTRARTRSVGVFAGSGGNEYFLHFTDDLSRFSAATALGNLGNMVAARVAQALGLCGPALTIDAACASSLIAVHLACRSILAGECELAIAGGVQTNLTPVPYVMFSPTGVLAPSGRCQPYSTSAAGFVPGEGGGAVLLKSLARARADGDPIIAIVRGSAMNNDGGGLSGMAPTPAGQADVIRRALAAAQAAPRDIGYVEGHGSATPIGDVVETRALGKVFGGADGVRYLGSVKSNIGHCFAAAGIAGLLKTVLALHHRQIPPTAGCEHPNQRLFTDTSFRPTDQLMAWDAGPAPRRAGVSSFGVGGTNCHLIVEEGPAPGPAPTPRDAYLIALAAPTPDDVPRVARAYADRLALLRPDQLGELVSGINLHARHPARRAAVVSTVDDAARFLRSPGPVALVRARPRVCVVFSGPGSQYVGMGRALYQTEPSFRGAIDECAVRVADQLPRPLTTLLFDDDPAAAAMDRIDVTQPVIFSFGYALWRWLQGHGAVAGAVLGHSAAEYLAAHVAGAFDLDDALRLVTARGRAMAATGRGKMAAVFADESRVRPWLADEPRLGFAAINQPNQVVISGELDAMDRVLAALASAGIASQELAISCAAHSPAMRGAADALTPELERTGFAPLQVPFYSTVTGEPRGVGESLDAGYFRAQLPAPVVFARAIARARADGFDTFIEIGPSAALSYCVEQVLAGDPSPLTITPLLRRSVPGLAPTLEALGILFERGAIAAIADARPLPLVPEPYPYRRRRPWLAPAPRPIGSPSRSGPPPEARSASPPPAPAAIDAPPTTTHAPMTYPATATPIPRSHEPPMPPSRDASARVLTPDNEPSIRDHVFRDRAIAPAALLLEFFLADARARDPGVTGLERVLVSRSLGLDGATRRVSTRATEAGETRLVLESEPASGGAVEEHALASPISMPLVPTRIDLAAIAARCPTEIAATRLYQHLGACRMTYGPTMTTVASIRRGTHELLARLELPPGAERDVTLHPAILDGAMQAIGGFLVDRPAQDTATFFGFSIQCLEVHAPARTSAWAHVRARTALSDDQQIIRCDVDILDDRGTLLVRYHDVSLRRYQEAAAPAATTGLRCLEIVRRDATRDARRRGAPPAELLLIGADSADRANLRRALGDLGVHVLATAASTDEAALSELLRRISPVPTSVLALDPAPDQLYALLRALVARRVSRLDDLVVVSRDAAPQAMLRAAAMEQRAWSSRGIEVADGELVGPLLGAVVDEWQRGDSRHVCIAADRREHLALAPIAPPTVAHAPDGLVWITGGLGGVGSAITQRLLSEPQTKLLITGRSASSAAIERLGDRALYVAADVTDAPAMRAARERAESRFGPVRGLIHAAGTVDQALLGERAAASALARFHAVWAPKAVGARVLAEVLSDRELDFVVFCSSMVALYGAPGQADYAAANAALDDLARRWPGRARRALSIAWGPWRQTGMMAAPENQGVFDAAGLITLVPAEAADALVRALAADTGPHVMIVDVRAEAAPALHERLGAAVTAGPAAPPADAPPPAETPTPEHVPALAGSPAVPTPIRSAEAAPSSSSAIEPSVRRAVAAELRRAPADVDSRAPFRQLGLDSLMAVRVVARLERELGLELHPTLLFEQPTLSDVVRYLEQRRNG